MQRKWRIIIAAMVFLLTSAWLFIPFLAYHQEKVNQTGWYFNDPVYDFMPVMDVSLPIFSITYGSIILYLILCNKQKDFAAKLMFAYGLIILFRMISLSMVPLREPDTLVHLQDPFLNNLIYPGKIVTDLFFSGHTALVFAIFMLSEKKWIFLILTFITGSLVIIQRVHYSIDVLAAIPFAWLASYLSNRIVANLWKENNV